MFTGIVEHIGQIKRVEASAQGGVLAIELGPLAEDAKLGDSICVNGVCLTLTALRGDEGTFDAMPETWRLSTLRLMKSGDKVNLERALAAGGRLGGHIMQGHVDGVGTVAAVERKQEEYKLWVAADETLMRYMIRKGSVAIDGVSLTVVDVEPSRFSVGLIPMTLRKTILQYRQTGDKVNLEIDIVNKWIKERLDAVLGPEGRGGVSLDRLRENGF